MLLFSQAAQAVVFDAPYEKLAEQNKDRWDLEDLQVKAKLATLEKRFGKKPNIIYIMTDDVGWGELGWQGGGKHRGTPSAELDQMAYDGMRFWSAYSEPSCTPSRVAINTGRHPVRTGLVSVLWPGETDSLSPLEKTLAEVLSEAGYDTAMWGKWHLGEEPWQAPERQGFDRTYYGLYNGAVDFWSDSHEFYENENNATPTATLPPFFDFPGEEEYKELTGIDVNLAGYHYGINDSDERTPIKEVPGTLGKDRQEAFEKASIAQIIRYIKGHNHVEDKPFFQQIAGSADHKDDKYVDHANAQ